MNAERLLALFEQISEAPDAIPRLRRFILDLAVRGKLVEQDPEDEPANKWLRMFLGDTKQTKRLTTNSQPDESAQSLPGNPLLPLSWAWVPLGRLVIVMDSGWSPQCENHPRSDINTWGVLKTTAVQPLSFDCIQHKELPAKHAPRPQHEAAEGDILITRAGPKSRVGISCVVDKTEPRLMISDKIIRMRLRDGLRPEYVALALNAGETRERIEDAKSGMAVMQMNISQGKLRSVPIPLPPLAEQHRIVAKVDELMALCDQLEAARQQRKQCRERLVAASLQRLNQPSDEPEAFRSDARFALQVLPSLTSTPAQIKQLRQTILNLAVRGKLVVQDPEDEPVAEVLSRNNIERSAKEDFFVPSAWEWVAVGNVSESRLGKMLDKGKNKGIERPYLRNLNVRWFDFDLSDLLEMRFEDSELPEYALRNGDVLICEGGEPGRAAVWDERIEGVYFQKAIHRARLYDFVDSVYFVYALRASADDGRLSSYFTGTGISHFTGKGLKSYRFPLPSLAEQHRIVAKVDELMALCDQLEQQLSQAEQSRRELLETVLREALEGSLPTMPSEITPATVG